MRSTQRRFEAWPASVAVPTALSGVALLHAAVLQSNNRKWSEYRVKAVYLYNFGRFVHGPQCHGSEGRFVFNLRTWPGIPLAQALIRRLPVKRWTVKPLAANGFQHRETLGNAASCSSVRQKKII